MIMGSAYQPSSRGNQMSQHAGKTLLPEVDPSNEALHVHHNNSVEHKRNYLYLDTLIVTIIIMLFCSFYFTLFETRTIQYL